MLRNGLTGFCRRSIVLRIAVLLRVALRWVAMLRIAFWRLTLRWITLLWLALLRCADVLRRPAWMRLPVAVRPPARVLRTGLFVRMWLSATLLWIFPARQLLPRLRPFLRSDVRPGL
jgi:hypothetical protein